MRHSTPPSHPASPKAPRRVEVQLCGALRQSGHVRLVRDSEVTQPVHGLRTVTRARALTHGLHTVARSLARTHARIQARIHAFTHANETYRLKRVFTADRGESRSGHTLAFPKGCVNRQEMHKIPSLPSLSDRRIPRQRDASIGKRTQTQTRAHTCPAPGMSGAARSWTRVSGHERLYCVQLRA